MKKMLKVIGLAALGGALTSGGGALVEQLAHAGELGAALGGIIASVIALYVKPPKKEDAGGSALRTYSFLLLFLFVTPALAAAQGPQQWGFNTFTTAVTLTTTTEAVVVSSPVVQCPRNECDVVVVCYAELTTSADTTDVVARIRRGTAITDTLVSEENEQDVKAAAGSIEPFIQFASEQIAKSNVQYSCTLDQVGASANGSAVYGGILVLVR